MKPRSRTFRPGDSALEPRTLLTGVVEVAPALGLPVSLATGTTIAGKYQSGADLRSADVPLQVRLTGSGKFQGPVSLIGGLSLGGFTDSETNNVHGAVTIRNKKGILVLELTGHGGQRAVPQSQLDLNAHVVRATGKYEGLSGDGTASVQFLRNTARIRGHYLPVSGNAQFTFQINQNAQLL